MIRPMVSLGVSDVSASASQYAEGFGWTLMRRDHDSAWFDWAGSILSLWDATAFHSDIGGGRHARGGHVALACIAACEADAAEMVKRLQSADWRTVRPLERTGHGGARAYLSDRDDHLWEVLWNPSLR